MNTNSREILGDVLILYFILICLCKYICTTKQKCFEIDYLPWYSARFQLICNRWTRRRIAIFEVRGHHKGLNLNEHRCASIHLPSKSKFRLQCCQNGRLCLTNTAAHCARWFEICSKNNFQDIRASEFHFSVKLNFYISYYSKNKSIHNSLFLSQNLIQTQFSLK